MGNNCVPKFIFRLSRFPVYRGSVLGRFYCIKMDVQKVECECMDWTDLAEDRDRWRALANSVMNRRAPQNEVNFLTSCKLVSFSKRTLLHGVSK
jgi:hypothetical protein